MWQKYAKSWKSWQSWRDKRNKWGKIIMTVSILNMTYIEEVLFVFDSFLLDNTLVLYCFLLHFFLFFLSFVSFVLYCPMAKHIPLSWFMWSWSKAIYKHKLQIINKIHMITTFFGYIGKSHNNHQNEKIGFEACT